MGSLLVVTGPPGAGKSTVARLLAEGAERSVLVEGDSFFGFLANGAVDPWLPASRDQNEVVTTASAAAAAAFARGGYTTVFDGMIGRRRRHHRRGRGGRHRLAAPVGMTHAVRRRRGGTGCGCPGP